MNICLSIPSELFNKEEYKDIENDIDIIQVCNGEKEEIKTLRENKYDIIDCGGAILFNGEKLESYEEYIKDNINPEDLKNVAMDLQCMYHVSGNCQLIDNRIIKIEIDNVIRCEEEILMIMHKYTNFNFFIENKELYAIPNFISKAIALRWLQLKNKYDTLISVGTGESDINTLYISEFAIIPRESQLITKEIVLGGIIIKDTEDISKKVIEIVNTLKGEKK